MRNSPEALGWKTLAGSVGLGCLLFYGGLRYYSDELTKNYRGYNLLDETTVNKNVFRLYASCRVTDNRPVTNPPFRYSHATSEGKAVMATTDFPESPTEIRRTQSLFGLLKRLGVHEFEATFAERARVSGFILCNPQDSTG